MTEQTHRNSLQPGFKLHWYEIKRILGQGGFGITYLAHDLNLDKDVAIKEYLPVEFAVREGDHSVHPISSNAQSQYKWGLDRFIAEARTLSRFEHPNIVRVFAVFEENNTGYMVMAYEHGQSLQSMLAGKKTLEETVLLKILVPILGGLEKIHKAGFIHRDIKPDNIFIREDGSPVLLDFGSARQALAGQTKTLTSLVSPGYAPFEQYYSKSDEQGPWSDIYGMGATLYRAVAGRAPMDAVDRSKSMLEGTKDTIVTAAEIGRGLYSERFLKAIDHAIKFKPKDRPQSITEWKREFGFKDNLEEIERLSKLESQPTRPGTRIAADKSSRFRPVLFLIIVALLSVFGIVHYRNTFDDLLTGIGLSQENVATAEKPGNAGVEAHTQQLAERERLKEEVRKLAEEKKKMEDERSLAEERKKQEEEARLAELERQKQLDEQKQLEEKRRLAEEKQKQEAAAKLAEQERQKQQEEQKRLEEQTRLVEERKKLEEEKQQLEKEKKKQEEAKLAEQERQKQQEEQKQLEERRLAEEKQKQEEAVKLAEQEKQQLIEQSRVERRKRSAKKQDSHGYVDDLVAQDLLQLGEKQKQTSVAANIDKWQSSGVLIKKGNTYNITATGQWHIGGLCKPTGPNGKGVYDAACWDLGGQTVEGYTHSALIGKIGGGNLAFYVGKEYRFTSEEEGVLYFMANDATRFFFDNSGSFSVTISVE